MNSRSLRRWFWLASFVYILIKCWPIWAAEPNGAQASEPSTLRVSFEMELAGQTLENLSSFFRFGFIHDHPYLGNFLDHAFERAKGLVAEGKAASIEEVLQRSYYTSYYTFLNEVFGDAIVNNPSLVDRLPIEIKEKIGVKSFSMPTITLLPKDLGPSSTLPNSTPAGHIFGLDPRNLGEIDRAWRALSLEDKVKSVPIDDLSRSVKAVFWLFGIHIEPREDISERARKLLNKLEFDFYQIGEYSFRSEERSSDLFLEAKYHEEVVERNPKALISDILLLAELIGRSSQIADMTTAQQQSHQLAEKTGVEMTDLGFNLHLHFSDGKLRSKYFFNRMNLLVLLHRLDQGIKNDISNRGGFLFDSIWERGLIRVLDLNHSHFEVRWHFLPLVQEVELITKLLSLSEEESLRLMTKRMRDLYQKIHRERPEIIEKASRGEKKVARVIKDFVLEMKFSDFVEKFPKGSEAHAIGVELVDAKSIGSKIKGGSLMYYFWGEITKELRARGASPGSLEVVGNRERLFKQSPNEIVDLVEGKFRQVKTSPVSCRKTFSD